MTKGVTAAEFSRIHHKSDTAVRKAIKAGRIQTLPDGSIDPNLPWPGGSEEVEKTEPAEPVRSDTTEIDDDDLDELFSDVDPNLSLTDARKVVTVVNAKIKHLTLKKELKELVPLYHVQKHIERIAINIKQTILHIPSRHASQIAAKLGCDGLALELELTKAITAEMNGLCDPVIPPD